MLYNTSEFYEAYYIIRTTKESKKSMVQDLTSGKPLKQIMKFTLPIFIGNVFQQLYSMVDTIIVGNTLGEAALAGVGATSAISFLIIGFVQGMTAGFSVKTSQYFGSHDEYNVKRSVATSFMLCAVTTVILTLISIFTTMPLLKLMKTPDEIIQYSYDYIVIIYAGLFATVFYNMVSSILRALGDSKVPLLFLIMASVINVGVDLLFIVVFKMGVAGAGWATVLSQLLSAIACLIYMFKKYDILKIKKEHFKTSWRFCYQHLAIGLPMALQYSIIAIGIMVQQSAVNILGTRYVSAYTAATKIDTLVTQSLVAMGAAIATYVGQNYGALRYDRIKKGVDQAMTISIAFAVLCGIAVYFGSDLMTGLFVENADAEMLALSKKFLMWQGIFYICLAVIYVYRNALQGMGHSALTMFAGLTELSMRIFASLLLAHIFGYMGICLSNQCAWIGADIFLLTSYYIVIGKKLQKSKVGNLVTANRKSFAHS